MVAFMRSGPGLGVTMNSRSSQPREVRTMVRARSMVVTLAISAMVGLGHAAAPAADRSEVDAATQQVQRGAGQIGQGKVLEGAGETAKGIGNTVVGTPARSSERPGRRRRPTRRRR